MNLAMSALMDLIGAWQGARHGAQLPHMGRGHDLPQGLLQDNGAEPACVRRT